MPTSPRLYGLCIDELELVNDEGIDEELTVRSAITMLLSYVGDVVNILYIYIYIYIYVPKCCEELDAIGH